MVHLEYDGAVQRQVAGTEAKYEKGKGSTGERKSSTMSFNDSRKPWPARHTASSLREVRPRIEHTAKMIADSDVGTNNVDSKLTTQGNNLGKGHQAGGHSASAHDAELAELQEKTLKRLNANDQISDLQHQRRA